MYLHQQLTILSRWPSMVSAAAVAVLALGLAVPTTSHAQTKPQAETETDGRFSLAPVDGGVLRLDRQTGEMTLCTKASGKMTCEPVTPTTEKAIPKRAEGTAERSGEVASLRAENRELRDRIRALEEMIETIPEANGGPPPPAPVEPSLTIPSEEDIDQALDYVERILKKFRDRVRRFDEPLPPEQPQSQTDESSPPL